MKNTSATQSDPELKIEAVLGQAIVVTWKNDSVGALKY